MLTKIHFMFLIFAWDKCLILRMLQCEGGSFAFLLLTIMSNRYSLEEFVLVFVVRFQSKSVDIIVICFHRLLVLNRNDKFGYCLKRVLVITSCVSLSESCPFQLFYTFDCKLFACFFRSCRCHPVWAIWTNSVFVVLKSLTEW